MKFLFCFLFIGSTFGLAKELVIDDILPSKNGTIYLALHDPENARPSEFSYLLKFRGNGAIDREFGQNGLLRLSAVARVGSRIQTQRLAECPVTGNILIAGGVVEYPLSFPEKGGLFLARVTDSGETAEGFKTVRFESRDQVRWDVTGLDVTRDGNITFLAEKFPDLELSTKQIVAFVSGPEGKLRRSRGRIQKTVFLTSLDSQVISRSVVDFDGQSRIVGKITLENRDGDGAVSYVIAPIVGQNGTIQTVGQNRRDFTVVLRDDDGIRVSESGIQDLRLLRTANGKPEIVIVTINHELKFSLRLIDGYSGKPVLAFPFRTIPELQALYQGEAGLVIGVNQVGRIAILGKLKSDPTRLQVVLYRFDGTRRAVTLDAIRNFAELPNKPLCSLKLREFRRGN